MTITNEESEMLATEISDVEQDIIDTLFVELYDRCKCCGLPAAKDDRAARLEAALIRFLLESRI